MGAVAVRENGSASRSVDTVPTEGLGDQDGQPFGADRFQRHISITALMFTSCTMACPVLAERMRYLSQLLDGHSPLLQLVSITVDPENDTPDVLLAYGDRYHRDPARWTFVTGKTEPFFDVVRMDDPLKENPVKADPMKEAVAAGPPA